MPQPVMRANSPDNFQTPPEAIDCLVPYLKRHFTIWEPACGEGYLVNALSKAGFYVFPTDIISGTDFLKYDPPPFDCIVTNPPFSIKEKFLARCYSLKKPFALLMPLTTFDSKERRQLFARHGVEVIMPPKRFSFETPTETKNIKEKVKSKKTSSSWFYTCWFTWGLEIGSQLTFTDPVSLDI